MALDQLDLAAIGADLARLTDLVREARMELPGSTAEDFARERDEILLVYDGYLEPRLGAPDAPIVVAIVGPGGAGKSTLLNSLAGERVAPTSVVRPTTRRPLIWADVLHPDGGWDEFSARARRHLGEDFESMLTESELTEHLTIIDTPALDHRDGAEIAWQAVALSDLCIFITTPSRYADGRAWEFLRRTRRRGVPTLFAINRLPRRIEEQDAILADLALRLFQRDLLAAPDPSLLFAVAESEVDRRTGGLVADDVAAIRKEIAEVADPVYRHGLLDETVYATARMVAERARLLTRPLAAEQPVVERLLVAVAHAYEMEARKLDEQLRAGELYPPQGPTNWTAASARVAGIVTRRAGTAANVAASVWTDWAQSAEVVEVEGLELWRHGEQTSNVTGLALESWRSGLEALALAHSKAGRFRWGSGPRVVEALWQTALSGGGELPHWVRRKFADRGAEVVALARNELGEALRQGLQHDGERFLAFLGTDTAEQLYSAIIDQADRLDARLDGLAAQIPSAWSEPVEEVEVVVAEPDTVLAIHIEQDEAVIEFGPEEIYHQIVPSDNSLESAVDQGPAQ